MNTNISEQKIQEETMKSMARNIRDANEVKKGGGPQDKVELASNNRTVAGLTAKGVKRLGTGVGYAAKTVGTGVGYAANYAAKGVGTGVGYAAKGVGTGLKSLGSGIISLVNEEIKQQTEYKYDQYLNDSVSKPNRSITYLSKFTGLPYLGKEMKSYISTMGKLSKKKHLINSKNQDNIFINDITKYITNIDEFKRLLTKNIQNKEILNHKELKVYNIFETYIDLLFVNMGLYINNLNWGNLLSLIKGYDFGITQGSLSLSLIHI